MNKKMLHMVTFVLTVVGALNWGLVGFFNFNLVETLLGRGSLLASLVYMLVGLSALYIVGTHKQDCKACGSKK